jgi:metal-responsive CopG/Arc/MetJ family transcriptional regulator
MIHTVATMRIVLDSDLLRTADQTARKLKTSRSALLREALRAHLKRLDLKEKERRDREGYSRYPDSLDESATWDKVVDWPDDWMR